jgi:hypothetical protein
MFCIKCGVKLPDGSKFCSSCGTKLGEGMSDTGPIEGGSSLFNIERKKAIMGALLKIKVFLDGNLIDGLSNGDSKSITIDNGKHFLHCEALGMDRSETIEFEAMSNKIGFLVGFSSAMQAMSAMGGRNRVIVNKIMETARGIK